MRVGKRGRLTEERALRRERAGAGFTFLELVIVVLVLGIITMMALPAMNDFFTDETLNAAADAIVNAMYYARTLAITTRADHGVVFDAEANSFQVMRAVGTPPDETYVIVEHPVTKRDYAVSFDDGPVGQGVDLYSVQFGLNQYVRFDNLGVPLKLGSIFIQYGGESWKIGVTATSCEISS